MQIEMGEKIQLKLMFSFLLVSSNVSQLILSSVFRNMYIYYISHLGNFASILNQQVFRNVITLY